MNRFIKTLVLSLCVCLVLAGALTGCGSDNATTTTPAELHIAIIACVDDPEGDISAIDVTVTTGVFDKEYTYQSTVYKAGDQCYIVTGRIKNNATTGYWVAYRAYGYDSSGHNVVFTMNADTAAGGSQVFITPGETVTFTLHLNWIGNAASFSFHTQKSAAMFP
jgi:uncharacterized protein YcfL